MNIRMKHVLMFTVIGYLLVFSSCAKTNNSEQTDSSVPSSSISVSTQNPTKMKSYLATFEIAATDLSRAINFYEAILDLKIEHMSFPGMEMGILPYKDQLVTAIIIQGEGYEPSPNGTLIYWDAGPDLQSTLDKVAKNGGTVILPKTPHADNNGHFAIFLDSEGNKMGLNSPG